MQRNFRLKFLSILISLTVLLVVFAACSPTPPASPNQQTATSLQGTFSSQSFQMTQQVMFVTMQASGGQQPFLIATMPGYAVATLQPAATLQALTAQPCIFQWTTRDVEDVTRAAQNAFARSSTLADVAVRAQVYGENCLDPDNTVRYFAPMTTDIYLTIDVDSLGNLSAVAEVVVVALDTLSAPLGVELPAKLGYLNLTVTADGSLGHLRTTFDTIVFARAQGFTGGALVDAIGGVIQQR